MSDIIKHPDKIEPKSKFGTEIGSDLFEGQDYNQDPELLFIDREENGEPFDSTFDLVSASQLEMTEKLKGNRMVENEKNHIDIKLNLNRKALEKVTIDENDPNRIAIESMWKTWAEDPSNIQSVGFDKKGGVLNSMFMITKDGEEYNVPLFIVRQSVEGVLGTRNSDDEMTGIKLKSEDQSYSEIRPTTKNEVRNIMRRVRIGGVRLKDEVQIFIREENIGIPVTIPIKQETNVSS